jgi:hypothetical protein
MAEIAMGGTAFTREQNTKDAGSRAGLLQAVEESGWRKPAKAMSAFELADLSGKIWRLKDLAGRAVLINV